MCNAVIFECTYALPASWRNFQTIQLASLYTCDRNIKYLKFILTLKFIYRYCIRFILILLYGILRKACQEDIIFIKLYQLLVFRVSLYFPYSKFSKISGLWYFATFCCFSLSTGNYSQDWTVCLLWENE